MILLMFATVLAVLGFLMAVSSEDGPSHRR